MIELDSEQYFENVLVKPFEAFQKGSEYPFSILDGKMFYDNFHKIIGLTISEREEYKDHARRITERKDKETEEAYSLRIQGIGKHLAFKDFIQKKAKEGFDMRAFIKSKFDKLRNINTKE